MDLVNSSGNGSIQEYDDSLTQSSISPNFLNNQQPPSTHVGPFSSTMFHPLSNYFHPSQTTPLPNTNLDTMWSKPVRSESNQPDLNNLLPISSSSSLLQNQIMNQYNNNASFQLATNFHTMNDQTHNSASNNISAQVGNRNPKKRSRASRRAPTTVLTTDTTNFRAMVQEFTGIPELPPFITSHHFPKTRLDLFTSASTITFPTYNLLRPVAHKLNNQLHHSFPPSSSIHNQLLSSSVDYLKQPHNNIYNMHSQNHAFTFRTIHDQTPQKQKYPLGCSSALVSKTQVPSLEIPPSIDSHLKMGNVSEELGILRHDDRVNLMSSSKEWARRTHDTMNNNDSCDHMD